MRTPSASRESLQNGNVDDPSGVASGAGQWPKQGMPLSHVRFEDESAHEAESRYLERLQQRQRQVLSAVLHAMDQGPLRSKPDVTNYINRSVGNSSFHGPVGSPDHHNFSVTPPTWDSERTCPACGSCLEERCPAEGRAAPDLRVLRGLQAACEAEAVLLGPCNSDGLSSPFPGLHTEWIRETHITDTVATHPEQGNSSLDSTSSSDSKDDRTSQSSRADEQTQVSSPRQWQHGSRPQGGGRWSRKAEAEQPRGLEAWPLLPEADDVVVGGEAKGARGHITQETVFLKEDAVPKLALEPKRPWSQGQLGPQLGSHWARPEDCGNPCRTASAVPFSKKLQFPGPGQPDQVTESLGTVSTSSLQQNPEEPAAPLSALQPALPLSLEVPTPPSSRKSLCPLPLRKAARSGHHRLEHTDTPLPPSPPRTAVLTPPKTQPYSPRVKHLLPDLSNNYNSSSVPLGLQEPWGAAVHKSGAEKDWCQESDGDGKGRCHFMFSSGQVYDSHSLSVLVTT